MHFLLLTLLATAPAPVVRPHPLTATDLQSFSRISEPRVSPDNRWVLFTVADPDVKANASRYNLWLAATDGSATKRLTTHEGRDLSGRWSPDGKSVVFLSNRSGSTQVWRVPVGGGEAVQLTRFPLDVEDLAVFPDGKRLLLTFSIYPDVDPKRALELTAERDEQKSSAKVKARVYDQLLFRHWDSWSEGKRKHVFVWKIGEGAPLDLMPKMNADAPPGPMGDSDSLAISPDGTDVIFAARAFAPDVSWSTNIDLYRVPASGNTPPKLITQGNPARDDAPQFSPDGRTLAYLAMSRPGFEADRQQIILYDRASGRIRPLAERWDRSPESFIFSTDGSALYVTAEDVGRQGLFRVDVGTGEVTKLYGEGTNRSPQLAGDKLVFTHESFQTPAELYTFPLQNGQAKPLTQLNAERLANTQMGESEQFAFAGAKGDTVHGFLLKPVGFSAAEKYPLVFIVHGGPQGSSKDSFHYRWNPQVFTAAGYVVVAIDPHGSTGYGQAFTDAISKDWGGAPFEDLMKGLDHVLAKYKFIDGSRACAAGASYGGYMMNWFEGHTDRFRCLVNHDGTFDTRFFYYDTEEQWFAEWDLGGLPWENREAYARFNPAEYVQNWKTPMLVIHGGKDFRITESHGFATFTALQRKGIPSRLVHFPDENHWVVRPANSVFWHEQVLGWLERWLKPKRAAVTNTRAAGPAPSSPRG